MAPWETEFGTKVGLLSGLRRGHSSTPVRRAVVRRAGSPHDDVEHEPGHSFRRRSRRSRRSAWSASAIAAAPVCRRRGGGDPAPLAAAPAVADVDPASLPRSRSTTTSPGSAPSWPRSGRPGPGGGAGLQPPSRGRGDHVRRRQPAPGRHHGQRLKDVKATIEGATGTTEQSCRPTGSTRSTCRSCTRAGCRAAPTPGWRPPAPSRGRPRRRAASRRAPGRAVRHDVLASRDHVWSVAHDRHTAALERRLRRPRPMPPPS